MSTLSSSLGGTAYSVDYGLNVGNLWFDIDTNNNTVTDSAGELASFWHFDHTTAVAGGKADLYSVALHEILHTLGMGTSKSWDDLVSGSNWSGAQASALNGTGTNLIDPGSGHIASGIMSTRLSDGMAQEVVMSPSITLGTRKELTQLDVAFMQDINLTAVPEPSTPLMLGLAVIGLLGNRRRQRFSR